MKSSWSGRPPARIYTLLFDPVQGLNLFEALRVGRALDEYDYVSFEDPLPSTDIDGLVELRQKLDVPIEVGEFLYSIYDFGEYIRRGAMDIVRLIADNVGGISGAYRIAQLADAFGMPCTPTIGATRTIWRCISTSSWRRPTVTGLRCPTRRK